MSNPITPCLWFGGNAKEAVDFYLSVFKDGKILEVAHYFESAREAHGMNADAVLSIAFEMNGQKFMAINARPLFQFNEAVSFMIECETQEEIDYYWDKLTPGGDPECQQCGWLKDKYGLSWQVTPAVLLKMILSTDKAAAERAFALMCEMKKLVIDDLQRAFEGK